MIKEFRLPDIGEGIAEAEIVRWLISEGAPVKEDQNIVEIETDKAVVTLPSPYSGNVVKLYGSEGETVKVGQLLLSVADAEENTDAPQSQKKDSASVVGALSEEEPLPVLEPVKATPAVRALAKKLHIDLTRIHGTGPDGRILKEDVERTVNKAPDMSAPGPDAYEPVDRIPLRGLRRTIAKRMQEARQLIPDVTIWQDADISALETVRLKEKKFAAEKGIKLTYLPFVIKAVLSGLKAHPYLNATLDDESEQIVLKKYYNIGIAVDTADGLMVFAIKRADQKNILELAKEIRALAEKARARKLDLSELKGSTFTVTNYGVVGASYGTPIINHPEVGILGIGKIEDRPVARDGQTVIRKIMPLSLAFDHRVVDGVEAARFLTVVIQHLEDPNLILIEGK
jgi:pyruvate dehydrogenase E2 component (dihydrolipoamide acetyltransferase)